jgi:hypothetical protein
LFGSWGVASADMETTNVSALVAKNELRFFVGIFSLLDFRVS